MTLWQKCPVCDGTGLVIRPPGMAGDQETFSSSALGPFTCTVCEGKKIIETPFDPTHQAIEFSLVPKDRGKLY